MGTYTITPEERTWLRSLGISPRSIRHYGLDRPMTHLAWIVLAREVIRYAATMREAMDAYTAFVLAWSTPANTVAHGGTVDMLDVAIINGAPGITHQRLAAVAERVHIESIRLRLSELIETFMTHRSVPSKRALNGARP